jgi:hypothetical protein
LTFIVMATAISIYSRGLRVQTTAIYRFNATPPHTKKALSMSTSEIKVSMRQILFPRST